MRISDSLGAMAECLLGWGSVSEGRCDEVNAWFADCQKGWRCIEGRNVMCGSRKAWRDEIDCDNAACERGYGETRLQLSMDVAQKWAAGAMHCKSPL